MTNIILVAVLLLIVGSAVMYLYRAKKRGEHCIGCPYAKQCGNKSCNCGSSEVSASKSDTAEDTKNN